MTIIDALNEEIGILRADAATMQGEIDRLIKELAAANAKVNELKAHALDVLSVRIDELKQDDVIVMRYRERINSIDAKKIVSEMEHMFTGHKVLVLDNGVDISVTRKVKE